MQIRKRSCREEYIATQVIESIADFTTKKIEKKLGASSKKDSICALLAWAFWSLSKSLKEIYGYYCLDIYWNWMKFVTNNKACCFVWTTHSVLTPIFELHMKDLFCCTTRIKNWQKWCWIWDFKPLRKTRYYTKSRGAIWPVLLP